MRSKILKQLSIGGRENGKKEFNPIGNQRNF
jgi:hypothetical protein